MDNNINNATQPTKNRNFKNHKNKHDVRRDSNSLEVNLSTKNNENIKINNRPIAYFYDNLSSSDVRNTYNKNHTSNQIIEMKNNLNNNNNNFNNEPPLKTIISYTDSNAEFEFEADNLDQSKSNNGSNTKNEEKRRSKKIKYPTLYAKYKRRMLANNNSLDKQSFISLEGFSQQIETLMKKHKNFAYQIQKKNQDLHDDTKKIYEQTEQSKSVASKRFLISLITKICILVGMMINTFGVFSNTGNSSSTNSKVTP